MTGRAPGLVQQPEVGVVVGAVQVVADAARLAARPRDEAAQAPAQLGGTHGLRADEGEIGDFLHAAFSSGESCAAAAAKLPSVPTAIARPRSIPSYHGRASCRERVCQSV